ncbi:MAG: hypothetical protein LAN63_02480 [Acidobacteriia bacterium]|nr:hypothetical protein [Terriglobia bacterium]
MGNMGNLVLELINAERAAAKEPNCTIEFLRLDQVTIARANHVEFPPQHRFTLPAFPQAQNLRCMITPSLYRIVQSEFFTLTDGQEKDASAIVLRDPAQWRPDFGKWDSLSPQFDTLKGVLANRLLKLKHGPDVGVVTPAVYDGMTSAALLLAKMALLNLFAVLSAQNDPVSTKPWFNFVKQILVIDQERCVAVVDEALFTTIDKIRTHLDDFKREKFFPGDTSLHTDNIPSEYQLTAPMISVKCAYEQGNVQFTMARVRNAQGDAVLLDCDMDEHSNVIEHVSDVFKHIFTGGTNPIDIHEYIVHHQQGVDLGYDLRPLGEGLAPVAVVQPRRSSRRLRDKPA